MLFYMVEIHVVKLLKTVNVFRHIGVRFFLYPVKIVGSLKIAWRKVN